MKYSYERKMKLLFQCSFIMLILALITITTMNSSSSLSQEDYTQGHEQQKI
jgi:hypothetical protein